MKDKKTMYLFLGILVTIIWGLNFVVAGHAVSDVPPFLLVTLRYLTVLIIFLPFTSRNGVPWNVIVPVGLFYGVVQFSGLFIGLKLGVSAGIASTIIQCQALFTIVLAYLFLNERLSMIQLSGLVISVIGLTLIALSKDHSAPLLGVLFIIIGGLGWAISNIFLKKAQNISAWSLNIWQSIIVIPIMLIASALLETNQVNIILNLKPITVGAILYIALLATGFGNYIWYKIVQELGPSKASPLSLLVPVFGLLGGWIINNEKLSMIQITGIFLIIIGLVIIQNQYFNSFFSKGKYSNVK